MQSSTQKIAAAISAVMQFIQEEAPAVQVAPTPTPVPSFSPWGVAGRQDAMLFRSLWQRRLGRGC